MELASPRSLLKERCIKLLADAVACSRLGVAATAVRTAELAVTLQDK